MGTVKVIRKLRLLFDVVFTRPDASPVQDGDVVTYVLADDKFYLAEPTGGGGGGGAPTTADYLVGTANAGLSNEIPVGVTPGGELGGTWAAPTVDAVHSGSSHAATQAAAEATAAAALAGHEADTSNVHGIADTTVLATDAEVAAAVAASEAGQVRDGDAAGGVLGGTYPNPSFAVDMATQVELDAVAAAAVQKATYDANTILKADSDNTPVALAMGASTIVARLATGDIVAATPDQIRSLLEISTLSRAELQHQQASGTDGGTATSGAWRTRTITTEASDPEGIVSLSANQFTLQAGTYRIDCSCVFWACGVTKIRLFNVTDSTVALTGVQTRSGGADFSNGVTTVAGFFTLDSAKVFEIQYYVEATKATTGQGVALSASGTTEVYASVVIEKFAIAEVDGLANHLADTSGAHDASAISFSPTGTIAATDVQAAIAEVASEASSTSPDDENLVLHMGVLA